MPIAVSLSIMGMFVLRCLHPPAAAVALIVVLGHVTHYRYTFFPVMLDSMLLTLAAGVYSNLTGKKYPNRPK
jgi:CBS domain-containing membrane protein